MRVLLCSLARAKKQKGQRNKSYGTLGLAVPRIEDRPFDAVIVDYSTTDCVPLAIAARILPRRGVTVGEEVTIVTVVGETGGCGVVPAWHTIKTRRLG